MTDFQAPTLRDYAIRPMGEADLPAMVAMIQSSEQLEPTDDSITLDEMTTWYHHPDNHTAYVAAFAGDGALAGFASLRRRPDSGDGYGQLRVHPGHRRRGLGAALFAAVEELARERGLERFFFYANQLATGLHAFLEHRGFAPERYTWLMRLGETVAVPAPAIPAGCAIRTLDAGAEDDLALLTAMRNSSFSDHFKSAPRTIEQTRWLITQPWFSADGVFLLFCGDQPAGFCITEIDRDTAEHRGVPSGMIGVLGVLPAFRGRGYGRALLLAGIAYVRARMPLVELHVEGKNARALALYKDVGFAKQGGGLYLLREPAVS
ncbi:MAG TPA: GNAT family N-acetyltransferase [Herpetosiphonaceae bacterium]